MAKYKLKKYDVVRIISGKHKGKEGQIQKFDNKKLRVFIKSKGVVNLRHQKPTQEETEGGIQEVDASIHISNVALVNPKNKKTITKVGYKTDSHGKKIRFAKATNTEITK